MWFMRMMVDGSLLGDTLSQAPGNVPAGRSVRRLGSRARVCVRARDGGGGGGGLWGGHYRPTSSAPCGAAGTGAASQQQPCARGGGVAFLATSAIPSRQHAAYCSGTVAAAAANADPLRAAAVLAARRSAVYGELPWAKTIWP